jgi:hypothetical protein
MERPQILLKPGVLDELEKQLNTNKTGLTVATGLSATQIYRTRTGKSKIGADFIAGILSADKSKKFDDYFILT